MSEIEERQVQWNHRFRGKEEEAGEALSQGLGGLVWDAMMLHLTATSYVIFNVKVSTVSDTPAAGASQNML